MDEFRRYTERYMNKENSDEVLKYFIKIACMEEASQERIKAMHRVGFLLHQRGDYERAINCYEWVIAHYEEDVRKDVIGSSFYNLGLMCKNGEGMPIDLEQAVKYFISGARYANNEACKKMLNKLGINY